MCFQRSEELYVAPTKHLFHLRLKCMVHEEVEEDYHWLISVELRNHIEELKGDNFQWM